MVKVWPSVTKMLEGREYVLLPTTRLDAPSEMAVPEIVAATVKSEALGADVGMAIVDVPTTKSELPKATEVPDMVIAGPPGDRVLLA